MFKNRITVCSLARIGIVATVFAGLTTSAKADTQIERNHGSITISINGSITNQDANTLQALEPELAYSSVSMHLNSAGGSLAAAITIGRLVRKYDGNTLILPGHKCYSSCALIFIAGVSRLSFGELGLHRPYIAAAPQSRETVEKQMPLMLSTLKGYVAEMGVTDNFYQQMVNTEPSQIIRYNGDAHRTIVPAIDPIYDEVTVSQQALDFGLTTDELRQRGERAGKCIYAAGRANLDPGKCDAIYWGLSEQVWSERSITAKRLCPAYSDKEMEIIKKTPRKQRWDLPLMQRAVSCQRDVMLGRTIN